jgi:hypothetical protein
LRSQPVLVVAITEQHIAEPPVLTTTAVKRHIKVCASVATAVSSSSAAAAAAAESGSELHSSDDSTASEVRTAFETVSDKVASPVQDDELVAACDMHGSSSSSSSSRSL